MTRLLGEDVCPERHAPVQALGKAGGMCPQLLGGGVAGAAHQYGQAVLSRVGQFKAEAAVLLRVFIRHRLHSNAEVAPGIGTYMCRPQIMRR